MATESDKTKPEDQAAGGGGDDPPAGDEKSVPKTGADAGDEEYDPDNPEGILGVRISVEWAGKRYYDGVVADYNPKQNQHFVQYDDGDKRWYHLWEKTFKILSTGEMHIGQSTSAAGFSDAFVPYVSKDPNARTIVSFHVLIDPECVDVGSGDRVAVHGSLAELGAWGVHGVPMAMDPNNPFIWNAQVEIPFAANENTPRGVFEFKFAIENGDDVHLEGGVNTRPTVVRGDYYHTFLRDFKNKRFKGFKKIKLKHVLLAFVRNEFEKLLRGEVDPVIFNNRMHDLKASYDKTNRAHAEFVVNQLLATVPTDNSASSSIQLLCLAGIVGLYGLTSHDILAELNRPGTTTWSYATGYVHHKPKRRPMPEPKEWCWHINKHLSVDACYLLEFPALLGNHHMRCVTGLRELSERISATGSYDWMRLLPLLEANKLPPRPRIEVKMEPKRQAEAYLNQAQVLSAHAISLYEPNSRAMNKAAVDASALTNEEKEKQREERKRAEMSCTLAMAWLRALVLHAPNMSILAELFGPGLGLIHFTTDLSQDFASRIRSFNWTDAKQIKILSKLVGDVPPLRTPRTAAAMLRNESCDAPELSDSLLGLVAQCVHEFSISEPVVAPVAEADDDKKSSAPPAPAASANPEMDAQLHELDSAAKEWVRRNHQDEPTEENKEDSEGGGVLGYFGYGKAKDKKPKPEELAKKRLDALTRGVRAVNSLLQIPYFHEHSKGLLFELSRCHFLKGSPDAVLQAICSLGGGKGDGFSQYSVHLKEFLVLQGVKILEEVAPAASRNAEELSTLVGIVDGELPANSEARHTFLYSLARAAGGAPPSLYSIFTRHAMWKQLFSSCGASPSKWNLDTPLNGLLRAVHATLVDTAKHVLEKTVQLRTLHTVLKSRGPFLELLKIINYSPVTTDVLAERARSLSAFDNTLSQVQCYVNFFCSCGVAINTERMRNTVVKLTQDYDKLELKAIHGVFQDLLEPYGTDIAWLFQLQKSALFLALWRKVGSGLTQPIAVPQMPSMGIEMQMKRAAMQEKRSKRQEMINRLLARIDADNNSSEEEKNVRRAQVAELFRKHEEEEKKELENDQEPELIMQDVVLSQEDVIKQMIPAVKVQWSELMVSVRNRSIQIQRLEETFAKLKTDDECVAELRLLARTGAGAPEAKDDSSWIAASASKLKDFLLLTRLRKWLPALLTIREQVAPLFSLSQDDDPYYAKVAKLLDAHTKEWEQQTLDTVSSLVAPVKKEIGSEFSAGQLDFLATLTESKELVAWLLEHKDQGEFNRLLQVCRPSTDEPRMLSAIASLVQIRTLLLQPLYQAPPYDGLQEFLACYRDVEVDRDALSHLKNIQSSFEGLLDVFEKQTRSPGIKSCYEVRDISLRGSFVFQACADETKVLYLEKTVPGVPAIDAKPDDPPPKDTVKTEPLEYLLDLRSKLMMTEIPEELEQEMQINALVDAFVLQLQLLSEMRDEIFTLYSSGHFDYQEGFQARYRFTVDGTDKLVEELKRLRQAVSTWDSIVRRAREQHYFLNYFTMREILRLVGLLSQGTGVKLYTDEAAARAAAAAAAESDDDKPSQVVEEKKPAKKELPPIWACPQCTLENDITADKCAVCAARRPAKYSPDDLDAGMVHIPDDADFSGTRMLELAPRMEFDALLHLASSSVQSSVVETAMKLWKDRVGAAVAADSADVKEPEYLLNTLGQILGECFGAPRALPSATRQSIANTAPGPASFEVGDSKIAPQPAVMVSTGPDLTLTVGSVSVRAPVCRAVPPPGANAKNRADMLIAVKEETRSVPVWVACAESPAHVIDVVLSVYLRRARLPEPGEVLFCTNETRLEDIDLLFWRFIKGKAYGRGDCVFCVADCHALSYTMQCAVVERLRGVLADYGTDQAASLLFVSGKPRQVILNSLSGQAVDLPPLDDESLKTACRQACAQHCGETMCVTATINGGGKTHTIMKMVSERQRFGSGLLYRRVPFRESSSAASLVARLSSFPSTENNAFHVDIGHIIPASANTVLFELLIVGVLKNSKNCRVYYRRPQDVFYLEIPNSPGNKTAEALRFLQLLPNTHVEVSSNATDLHRPIFTNPQNTRISTPDYDEIRFVCKYLRAWEAGKFTPGPNFDADYDPWVDADVTEEEAFKLLSRHCAADGFPSYLIFHSFLRFMYTSLRGMYYYPIFNSHILANWQGLENLKHVFINLLIETTKDFALRAVPRGRQFGVMKKKRTVLDDDIPDKDRFARIAQERMAARAAQAQGNDNADDPDVLEIDLLDELPDPPAMARIPSAELTEQAQQLAPPPLVRELSNDMAKRFQQMVTWEDTEHPVVLFYTSSRGQEVDGMDILSLNPRFVDRYIQQGMKATLKDNMIDLDKDWKKLTSEQGMQIIRKVEGFNLGTTRLEVGAVDPSYVVTIDNLLKMLSIQLRLQNSLPVVIMGETGCGKSSLIRQLCAIIRAPLRTLNIHGGMEDPDIIEWMAQRIAEARRYPRERFVVFLDEVNTCNCMGLFKEMICDRSMNGVVLPENIRLIAACNPYRLKKSAAHREERMAGLIFDHHASAMGQENVGTGIKDPLKNLVYRVHPLPESMVDHVFDFGALAPETERLYIKAMLRRQLSLNITGDSKEIEVTELVDDDDEKSDDPNKKKKTKKKKTKKKQSKEDSASSAGRAADEEEAPALLFRDMSSKKAKKKKKRTFFRKLFSRQDSEESLADAPQASPAVEPHPDLDIYDESESDDDEPVLADTSKDAELAAALAAASGDQQQQQERLLRQAKKKNKLTAFGEFVEVFSELICAAQEFVRTVHDGERSVVSLRDVARCVKVFRWFGTHYAGASDEHIGWTLEDFFKCKEPARAHVRAATFLSLAYCYHARLPRDERRQFCKHLEDQYAHLQLPLERPKKRQPQPYRGFGFGFGGFTEIFDQPKYGPRSTWLKLDAASFNQVLRTTQRKFVKEMNLGQGIALNEALLENLFMILVSVLNKIPIFVIGKPGSSKSLAMNLIQSNLNGDASDTKFLRSLPAVEVFSYQCSPLSTSQGIEQAFEAADRYQSEAQNTVVVVLLDEVGLAEQSPHLPLKVLHKVLDEKNGEQPVVGISNWALDPAKMNRAVHLYRPAPTVEDLSVTAEGMVMSANLKGYLQSLARAYSTVYHAQQQADFWGLREFYSTVRHINRSLQRSDSMMDSNLIMNAVQRNFGGRPQEMTRVVNTFFSNLGLNQEHAQRDNVVDLVKQNLASTEARHLMLLTENNAALALLFDYSILTHDRTEVIFGSDFPLDKTDLQICLNIQRIKLCMAEGITVVLVHCESLYESLYDLLNQHYTEYGGQLYVRLAFGTHSRLCPMHRKFRVVVVVEKTEAYTRLAPPLLNRFEKQVMERQHLLTDDDRQLLVRLHAFANTFASSTGDEVHTTAAADQQAPLDLADPNALPLAETRQKSNIKALRASFCGFHTGILSSLAQSIPHDQFPDLKSRVQEAIRRLMWCAVPEAVCRVMSSKRSSQLQEEHFVDPAEIYFKNQRHDDLVSFAKDQLEDWGDDMGSQTVLMTYSPFNLRVADQLKTQTKWKDVSHTVLHEMSSERDLIQRVEDFFSECKDGSVLLVQCDPLAASLRRIEHARYICENARARARKKLQERDNDADASDEKASAPPSAAGTAPADHKEAKLNEEFDDQKAAGPPPSMDAKEAPAQPPDLVGINSAVSDHDPSAAGKKKKEQEVDATPGKGVHVVLLVHLPRNEVSYNFDFDLRWRYAFIDSTEPSAATGLPDIQSMLGHSMSEIMSSLDLRLMLLRTFRSAMTRLVYLHQRTNNDVRNQILYLLRLLEDDAHSSFVGVVKDTITTMVQEADVSLDIMATARQEHELALAGTFQAALHRKISETVSQFFAIILSHIDRNSGLYLLTEQTDNISKIWLHLFRHSFGNMDVFARSRGAAQVEVAADGAGGHPFRCRFPFSFYVSRLLESSRQSAETAYGNTEHALQQQFGLIGLEHGLTGPLPLSIIQRYVYDFTCMHAMASSAWDRESQAKLVLRALTLHGGTVGAPKFLTSVHARYWACERRLRAYFELVDAVPAAKEPLLQLLEESQRLDENTDVLAVQLAVKALDPQTQGWKKVDDYAVWTPMVNQARPTLIDLVDGAASAHRAQRAAQAASDAPPSDAAPSGAGTAGAVDDPSDMKSGDDSKGAPAGDDSKGAPAGDDSKGAPGPAVAVPMPELPNVPGPCVVDIAQLEKVQQELEKLIFTYTFVRDVSSALLLAPVLTLETLNSIRNVSLRTQKTFRVLIRMLSDLNRKFARQGSEVECDICCCIPTDPVRSCSNCRRLVCRKCVLGYLKSKNYKDYKRCFYCQATDTNMINEEAKDQLIVKLSRGKEEQLQRVARRFMEFYIISFCFTHTYTSVASSKIEHALLQDFILLLAKRQLSGISEKYFIDVLPPGAGRVSLLRELLNYDDPDAHAFVVKTLINELEFSASLTGFLDTPLAVCYASVQEELLSKNINTAASAIAAAKRVEQKHLEFQVEQGAAQQSQPVHEVLRTVATMRRIIIVFCELLCRVKGKNDTQHRGLTGLTAATRAQNMKALRELQDVLSPLLTVPNHLTAEAHTCYVRSLRVFLLKNLEAARGLSFVRSSLVEPPLGKASWVKQWKESGDTGMMRFLGTNKLPRHNPFVKMPLYDEVNAAVSTGLAPTGNLQTLENFVRAHAGFPHLGSVLMAALVHEVFLLRVLPEIPPITRRKAAELLQWLRSTDALSAMSQRERNLLIFFANVEEQPEVDVAQVRAKTEEADTNAAKSTSSAGGFDLGKLFGLGASSTSKKQKKKTKKKDADDEKKGASTYTGPVSSNPARDLMLITPHSSAEDIALVRVIAHVVMAAASQSRTQGLFTFLYTVLFKPEKIGVSFLPAMAEDVTAMAVRVLGGRWYKCPNGHAYYVDMCGRPTVIQKCATCGVDIGGTDHNLLQTNQDLDDKLKGNTSYSQVTKVEDKSDPGYCLRSAEEEKNPFETVREVQPMACRFERFVIHCAFVAGAALGGGKFRANAMQALNKDWVDPMPDDVVKFFVDHVRSDFNVMRSMTRRSDEDVAMLAHMAVHTLAEEKKQYPAVLTKEQRNDWEQLVAKQVGPILAADGVAERLEKAYAEFGGSEEDEAGAFVSELQEKISLDDMSQSMRAKTSPALWRYRKPFSLQDFRMELNLSPANAQSYPLLSTFLAEEDKLRGLRHVPGAMEWVYLLLQKYNRRIDYETASKLTVAEVLAEAAEPVRWRRAFEGYTNAWNDSWQFVERFGCMEIPELYKKVEMSESTPVSFCLPSDKDEGICPLTLARFLGAQHNRFLERVDEYLLMRGEELQRSSNQQAVVSSKFFSKAHALHYDFGAFVQYLEKQCVQHSNSGSVVYDFRAAEQYLLDAFFTGKPLIDLEVPMMQYTNAAGQGGSNVLKQKVKQERLAKEVIDAILKEVSTPSAARHALELLETCISFLQATGGSFVQTLDVGEKTLGEYVSSVLMMKEAEFGSRTISSKVCLKHIDSLWRLLRDKTVVDPFAHVRPKYREPFDEKDAQLLNQACPKLKLDDLIPAIKDFICGQLTEDHMSADQSIKTTVGYLDVGDVYMIDLPWFAQNFPESLQMRNMMAAYDVLVAAQKL